ncbi:MAG TPA: prephenate dehydrogenase [Kineosporiaceae bacterium]
MSLDPDAARALGSVRVLGTGLLGTSLGLALHSVGTRVLLHDPSPTALAIAVDLGAGEADPGGTAARLTVVAAPPDVTADVVAQALLDDPDTTVTDVASVKTEILRGVGDRGADLSRYVGSHPMAGRERSGPLAARGDLFVGRPWVICPGEKSEPARRDDVRLLAQAVGARPVVMPAGQHDVAVALVSHLPQVAASLVAARLPDGSDEAVSLAGQGLRDVTRIAASDPLLWAQILAANAGPVVEVLERVRADLADVIADLRVLAGSGAVDTGLPPRGRSALAGVADLIARGNLGRERIPGKHGGGPTRYAVLTVVVPDRPGQLGRLFADIGTAGINIEEITLEHAPGRAVGLVEVSVLPTVETALEEALAAGGWVVVG